VQPGKPFAFGVARRHSTAPVLLFGLPGNPVSTFVTFELFVRPAIRRLDGECLQGREVDRGRLLEPVTTSHGRRAFLRVSRAPALAPDTKEHQPARRCPPPKPWQTSTGYRTSTDPVGREWTTSATSRPPCARPPRRP